METFQCFQDYPTWFLPVFIVLILWDIVWKIIAMWKSARNNHLIWFICIHWCPVKIIYAKMKGNPFR